MNPQDYIEYIIAHQQELVEKARSNAPHGSPDGYAAFYTLVTDRAMPNHIYHWINELYVAEAEGKGLLVEAFRGSTKTTALTNLFPAYRIGLNPVARNLLTQSSDLIASDNMGAIAQIIMHNLGWKLIFPTVVPDKERGWSEKGFNVKRSDIDYGEWQRMVSSTHDPNFVGFGYNSSSIIGHHPDGLLVFDDIDTEDNTRSDKERTHTRNVVKNTILKTAVPGKTMTIVCGTPWVENDTLSYFKSTGNYRCVKTPLLDENGLSVWPEVFTPEEIEKRRREGDISFSQMYLLDIKAIEGQTLKKSWLHWFPYEKIDHTWPVIIGVDYASSIERQRNKDDTDYCTIAWGRKIPGGGVVIEDGFRARMSQGEAEHKLKSIADNLNPTVIGVESLGTGKEFYQTLVRSTMLPVVESKVGNRSKSDRFEKELAPLFEYSRMQLSDGDSDFLKNFQDEWLLFPRGKHDDCLDAVYHMARVGMDAMPNVTEHSVPRQRKVLDWSGLRG